MHWLLRALPRVRWRHAPLLLPALVVVASELAYRLRSAGRGRTPPRSPPALDWGRGLSIVIPERGDPAMLETCLRAAVAAIQHVDEPVEVIVVVNGSDQADYETLRSLHPAVRWIHYPRALGFTRAVLTGVRRAAHGATYLLNSDMRLDARALHAALEWRSPRVFAIASQIFMAGEGGRREESGWTAMSFGSGRPVPSHRVPPDDAVRGTVWAGAGAALYNTRLLRALLPGCLAYDPFYWEDVDLGVRAWRMGYESLCCPASRTWHGHRVTVRRFYPPAEVSRIFERNRLQFLLRHPFPRHGLAATLRELARCDPPTARELGRPARCIDLWRARRRAFQAPLRDVDYAAMTLLRRQSPAAPCLLIASPFAVLPPRHGGAVRTHRLAQQLARQYEVILVSDEARLYGDLSDADRAPFAMVHLVGARPASSVELPARIARIASHSHAGFRQALGDLAALYSPTAVVVEHVELAGLVDSRPAGPAWILSLQDVLLSPDDPAHAQADALERDLMDRFDGVVVSSPEDQALLGMRPSCLVANGIDAALAQRYRPSTGCRSILFVGPFRAPNNWDGIAAFVESVYPRLEALVPGVSLTILGGRGAAARARACAAMMRPSIRILDEVDDVAALYLEAAVTINPQRSLRGSSLKVLESLAIGRVCVSTTAGARGREGDRFRGLVVVPGVEDFLDPLVRYLTREPDRISIEVPEAEKLHRYTWDAAGEALRRYVAQVVARRQRAVRCQPAGERHAS